MIRTDTLTRHFGSTIAVDGVSLEIQEGEVFGLLGPNGAGKTTVVRMLAALIAPTRGAAWIDGLPVVERADEIRARIGILTEMPGHFGRLSAEENLTVYGRLHGVSDIPGQIQRYLELLGLWERRRDLVDTFSKGMRQKLAIARALLPEPKLLFLDEPTSALDPESALVVRNFIADLRREGRTTLLCTHNLDEADRLCDRVGVLKQSLIRVDTPRNLKRGLLGASVLVQLAEVTPALLERTEALPFVAAIERVENQLRISLDDPERQNPELIRALVDAGAEIQFVEPERHSLEDVYFKVINQQRGGE